MIGSLTDTLILIVAAILLLGGEKDLSGAIRNIGRYWQQMKRAETDFRKELNRELSEVDMNIEEPPKQYSRPSYAAQRTADEARIRELEMQVKELQEELERLRRENGAK